MQALMHNPVMDKQKKETTVSFQVSITPQAKGVLDQIAEKTEIPQKRLFSRMVEFFAVLPPPAQKMILWPEEDSDEINAFLIAVEHLKSLRDAALAAEKASKSARGKSAS